MGRRGTMGRTCAALIFIMIVVFAYLPIRIMRNASSDGNRVARSHEVRKEIRDISEALKSVVYEHRNFVFTGEPALRSRRDNEIIRLLAEMNEVHSLVADNPTQYQNIQNLKSAVDSTFLPPLMKEVPLALTAKIPKEEMDILDQDKLTAPLFAIIDDMDQHEIALLKFRQAKLEDTIRYDSYISIGLGIASTLLLFSLYYLYRLDTREKERHAEVLRNANIEVENANQMKSDFLAKMSHEIRTPLAAIIGFAELLSSPDLTEAERSRNVDVIRRNSKALGQIIDDILDLSKVEAGKISIEHLEFDLTELLSDVFLLFTKKAKEKGVHFSVESSNSIPDSLISDPTRIRQILINMVSNALKFTNEGSVRVLVSWEQDVQSPGPAAGVLTFSISDTGVGISEVQQEKLFQPFSQAEDSTARQFGGTGLGLVLSRQLAQLLGGNVHLAFSVAGRGSTFIVTLKAVCPTAPLEAAPVFHLSDTSYEESLGTTEDYPYLEGVRILLAEDAPDNQLLITELLESTGAQVVVVDNGRDAVNYALKGDQHLILMDVQMPIMNGHEASRELRSKGYLGPIVALTAHAMVEERQRSHAVGYDDYLTKPIDSQKLIQTIRTHTLLRSTFKAELNPSAHLASQTHFESL